MGSPSADVELPAGVVVAARSGTCARCGTKFVAGTRARRYGGGLRPVACGCHPVAERSQTAPAQPAADPWTVKHDWQGDVDSLRRQLEHETLLRRRTVEQLWRALNPGQHPPEWYEIDHDSLLVQVQDLETDAANLPSAIARVNAALRVERKRVESLQGQEVARDAEITQHVEARGVLSAQVAELVAKLGDARGTIANSAANDDLTAEQLDSLQAERDELQASIDRLTAAAADRELAITRLTQQVADLTAAATRTATPAERATALPAAPEPAPAPARREPLPVRDLRSVPVTEDLGLLCQTPACSHPQRMHTEDVPAGQHDGGCRRAGCYCARFERSGR